MKRIAILLAVLVAWIFSGCAFMNVSLVSETKSLEEKLLEGRGTPKILIIDLDGVISFKDDADYLRIAPRPSKVAFFREALLKAEADDDIAGVIIRINSPGGSVAASDAIYHELMSFRQKRNVPVTAYITELGASGAYYVASAADRIVASPTAVVGSMGVIAMKLNIDGLLLKLGVSDETYKSGSKKDFWSPFRPSTPEEKMMLQGIIDRLHGRFIKVVHGSRQEFLTEQEVRVLADGRIFSAGEALEARLIDRIAYLDETIQAMRDDLHVAQVRVITYARPRTFKSNFYSEMPWTGPQVINLVSINAEALSLSSGVQFMYLWNP